MKLGHEFMPPLNEGDLLYMPITFPNISIEEAKRQLQYQDRILKSFPEVETVFGKVGRSETATDPAPITMVETTVRLRPQEQWRKTFHARWYSSWAPGWLKPVFRPIWPEEQRLTWEELTAEMNKKMQFPGWTNAWTMPIKTRVDMLTTGVRTPIGIKVFGTDLDQVEKIGTTLEHVIAPIKGTRSVLYERNLGGLYVDIIPKPEKLGRYGLRVADVERVIESAIGGTPIGTTIEGRNRFTINVRYPRDLRGDLEALRRVLVPIGPAALMPPRGGGGGMGSGMGTQGALWPPARQPRRRARREHGEHGGRRRAAAAAPAAHGLTLPSGRASMSDACRGMGGGDSMAGAAAIGAGRCRRADADLRRLPTCRARPSCPSARSRTSASRAVRPWCATRPACWSATSTSTSTRASATSAAT